MAPQVERWLPVKGNSLYSVSSLGRVKRGNELLTTSLSTKHGIPIGVAVVIKKGSRTRTYYVRRLVAQAFLPNPRKKPLVIHVNGNKRNCRASNLRWVTKGEIAEGIPRGQPVEQIDRQTRKVIGRFRSIQEATRVVGANASSIRGYLQGKQRHAAGYLWRVVKPKRKKSAKKKTKASRGRTPARSKSKRRLRRS